MAIFHFHEKNISRSDGRSAVACAAYRAGEKLHDHTYGKVQDYRKKQGVLFSQIYSPEHTQPDLLHREQLWNAVEQADTNKNGLIKANARLAKEYTCALPHELTDQQRIELVNQFCQTLVDRYHVIVDASIHRPHRHVNQNHHVHIMLTTRYVDPNTGQLGKKQRIFNDQGPEILKQHRSLFCSLTNQALAYAGHDIEVDHRSFKDQGLAYLEPTQHEGPQVTALRRQGISTDLSRSNDLIRHNNQMILDALQQTAEQFKQQYQTQQEQQQHITQQAHELRQQYHRTDTQLSRTYSDYQAVSQALQDELQHRLDQFIQDQDHYAEFMQQWRQTEEEAERKLRKPRERYERTQEWRDKNDLNHYAKDDLPCDRPRFYLDYSEYTPFKTEVLKEKKQRLQELVEDYKILSLTQRMRNNAEKLQTHDIELPEPAPSWLQQLKLKPATPSYQSLLSNPFEQEIIEKLYRQYWKKREQEEENARLAATRESNRRYIEQENRRKKEQAEHFEQQRRIQQYQRDQEKKALQPVPQKQKIEPVNKVPKKPESDNDYTPW